MKSECPESEIVLARIAPFQLGGARVTPALREIQTAHESRILEPRVMQVLVALAEAEGRIVSRDELIARCWNGRAISEDAINRALAQLRRLATHVGIGTFELTTIRKIGYRLICSANASATEEPEEAGTGTDVVSVRGDALAQPVPMPVPLAAVSVPSVAWSVLRAPNILPVLLSAVTASALTMMVSHIHVRESVANPQTMMVLRPVAQVGDIMTSWVKNLFRTPLHPGKQPMPDETLSLNCAPGTAQGLTVVAELSPTGV